MSDSKQVQEKWRAEQLRAQRKARLARMKSKSGGKKPIQTSNPLAWVVTSIILVIAVIAGGLYWAVGVGIPQRSLTAMTVNNEAIKAVEVDYYYHSLLSNYSIDATTADGQNTLKSDPGVEGFKTVADYLKDMAAQEVQQYAVLAANAAKDGVTLSADDSKRIADYLDSLESTALSNKTTFENYLISTYGKGINTTILTQILNRYLLAMNYATTKQTSFTFNADELKAGYEKSKDDYDIVNYRTFYLAADIKTGASDAEKTKALEAARTKSDEMLAKITSEASFKEQCIAYAADTDKDSYKTTDASLKANAHKADLATDQATWLFSSDRKAGDKTVIESTSGYYVLYFVNRSRADYRYVNIRHILISAAKASATDAQIAEAKTKAESILAQYKSGAKTEDSFAALAKTNSADSNASEGGLYEDVYPGQMVDEFNDWCFDTSRKAGDVGIVQTSYGFHVMYYVGQGSVDWEAKVKANLQSDAYATYLQAELKKYPYTKNSFGMRFVG